MTKHTPGPMRYKNGYLIEIALKDIEALVVHCGGITPDDAVLYRFGVDDIFSSLKNWEEMCRDNADGGIITPEIAAMTRGSL